MAATSLSQLFPRKSKSENNIKNGTITGFDDLFDDPAYDRARGKALEIADYMRRHGPFEPHRLPLEDMEYTTLPKVMEKLKDRFEQV